MDGTTEPSSTPGNPVVPPGLIDVGRLSRAANVRPESVVTLTGTVEQGVESRSIVLLDGAGSPLAQLGGAGPGASYPLGARVEVTGRFVNGLRTTGQQGRPFRVDKLKVLEL